jgi:hypothetical protein
MFVVPDKFLDAWATYQHGSLKWCYAIKLELIKMDWMKVWQKIQKTMIPKGCQYAKHRWVFNIKCNSV